MRPHDPYGINSFGGFLSTTVNYVAGCSLLSGVEAFADNVSVLSSLSFTLTTVSAATSSTRTCLIRPLRAVR